ncbi:hypothetical protein ACFHW0_25730 [Micromonospora sp. LOL_025]|uniref:hypothetical protein n=1 Tax=Micromonospora sp. LOL_025 TaxID=3345413 RepID=UPI003A8A67DC
MRTVVEARLVTRLLVPGALLFTALGSPAVAGLAADDSHSRTVAASSVGDLSVARGGGLVLPPGTSGCLSRDRESDLWDNLFPNCNNETDPVTTGGAVH